jgi:hypothetical protein
MSPQRKGSRRSRGWRPPRDRREVVVAVLASLTVIVVTFVLVWVLRPNQEDTGPHPSDIDSLTTPSNVPTTTLEPTTTAPTTPPSSTP